jgi:predicted HTH transcriptional regulator
MTLSELNRLVAGGESGRVEFKLKLNHPEKVVREAVAFANASGGHIFLGVSDEGYISGVKNPLDEIYAMQKALGELCRPTIEYSHSIIPVSEKRSVLHFHIKAGKNPPYFAFLNKNHRLGKSYVRVGDKSVQTSKEMRAILKNRKKESVMGFAYGEKEKALMEILVKKTQISVREYAEMAKISMPDASDVLIRLTLTNVIRIIPDESEDRFEFVE